MCRYMHPSISMPKTATDVLLYCVAVNDDIDLLDFISKIRLGVTICGSACKGQNEVKCRFRRTLQQLKYRSLKSASREVVRSCGPNAKSRFNLNHCCMVLVSI